MPAEMTLKEKVLAVLPEACPEETQLLLDVLAPEGVEVTREPFPALVMMGVRDCFETPFDLGEVLVTTAVVRRDGRPGHGTILGDEPAKALLLACLDLLDDHQQAHARERLAPHLARLARRVRNGRRLTAGMTGSTRVEFQSMAAE
ncbi:MAG: phosphonate C-P lyase system protein PhnG [Candidatus Methylomirabilia bacterium]